MSERYLGSRGGIYKHRGRVVGAKHFIKGLKGPKVYPTPIARSRRGRRTIQGASSGFGGAAGDAKYIDIATATKAIDSTGSITHLSIVTQGTTVNSRDGKAFRCTSLQMRGNVSNGSTATANDCVIMLVWDKQPNKALAGITDILDAATTDACNKRENSSRFVVIRRWDFALTGKNDGSTVPGFYRTWDKYVRLPPDCVATCTAADTTGVIANRVSGALLLVTLGNTAAGTAAASLYWGGRMNFVDI